MTDPQVIPPPGYTPDDQVTPPAGYTRDITIAPDPAAIAKLDREALPQSWWEKLGNTLEQTNTHIEQGIGDAGRGAWDMFKRMVIANPEDVQGQIARLTGGPLGPLISDILMSHVETAKKAQTARPGIGVLYGGAAAVPVIGPMIASTVETATGTPATYQGGRVVDPGQPAQPARAFGQVLGNVAIGALTEGTKTGAGIAAEVPGAIKAKLADKYVKSTLNPVEQAAVDYALGPGQPYQGTAPRIRLSPGTITGNKFLQAQEALTQNRPFGATVGAEFRRGTEADIQADAQRLMGVAHPEPATPESVGRAVNAKLDTTATSMADALVDRAHPASVTPESVGRAIPAKIDQTIKNLSSQRDAAYQDAWQGRGEDAHTESVPVRTRNVPVLDDEGKPTGQMTTQPVFAKVNMPVDVREIKQLAAPMLEEMDWMPAADKATSAGYRALQKIVEGDDFIPAWAAEKGLSGLKEMARMAPGEGVRDTGQAIAASLISDLQQGIDGAVAKVGPDAIEGLKRGRSIHANIMEIEDVGKQLRAKEPVQNFNRLVNRGDTGADFLRKVQNLAPEQMQPAGRALLQQIVENGDRTRWNALGPETKKILFPDAGLRAGIDHYLDVSDVVKQLKDNKPVQNFGRLVQPHDLSIDFLRDVAKLAPETMEPLGRAWIQQQFERAMREGGFSKTTGLLNDWRELGELTKRTLYPSPKLRAELDSLFKVADMASRAPNPSGTALVAGSDSWNPGKLLAGYIGSKALFTPEGIRLLTQAGNPINRAQAAFAATKLRDKFGPPSDEPPPTPPGGGGAGPAGRPGRGGPTEGGAAAGSLQERLQTIGDEAYDRVKKSGTFQGRTLPSLFPAEVTKDMATWGAARIANGAIDFGKWSKAMLDDAADIGPEAAEKVRGMLPQLYKDSQKAYEKHAQTIGAQNIADLPQIMKYYRAGKEGKNWYNFVKPALQPLFGQNTDLFLRMFAATSPNTKVTQNVLNAVKAYRQFLTGEPFTGMPAHVDNLNRAVAGVKMSGPKVGAFGPNLLGNLTPVTVDLWMARAILGRDTVTPLQSKLVDYMTSQAAKKAGLEPAEMQAAVWTGIKKLQKSRDTSAPPETIVKEYLDKNPSIRRLFEDSLEMSKEHFQGLQSKQAPAKPPRN